MVEPLSESTETAECVIRTPGPSSSTDSAAQMMEDGSLYVGDGSDMPEGVTIAPAAGNDMGGGPGGGPGGPGGQ